MRARKHEKNRDTCIVTVDRYKVFQKFTLQIYLKAKSEDLHEDAIFDAIDEACTLESFKAYGIKSYGDV